MPGHLDFEFRPLQRSNQSRQPGDDAPMRILLCGDFSGRGARNLNDPASLATRPVVKIDVDNLDDVIDRFAPALSLSCAATTIPVNFGSMDDFHPDSLFKQLDIFQRLRDLRQRLQNPSTFKQASSELLSSPDESEDETVQRLMGVTQADVQSTTVPASTTSGIDGLLHSLVAPHIVASSGSEQKQLIAAVDHLIATQMRELLHDPSFQAIESLWRSVQFLITRLEVDEALQLFIFDVTRAELETSASATELEQGGLWKALVDRQQDAAGGPGWSMVVALEAFDASRQDVMTLASLASIAAGAGAAFIATASPTLYGCENLHDSPDHHDWQVPDSEIQPHWQALRASPLAAWIGLVTPRLLLRLPYGKASDPLEFFEFEEMTKGNANNALLWGHSSVACALLAGTAFLESGSQSTINEQREVDDLPAWVYEDNDERLMYPCAEAWLSDRAADWLMSQGMMVLASRRDRPAAQLLRWQSIAEPAKPLAGLGNQ